MIGIMEHPLTQKDKDDVLQMLDANIEYICIANYPEDVVNQVEFAIDHLRQLASSRILELFEAKTSEPPHSDRIA